MTRVCHCVGYQTNPGGVCCKDLPHPVTITTSGTTQCSLTEKDIRRIIREELRRHLPGLR